MVGERSLKLPPCGFIGQLDLCAKEYWNVGFRGLSWMQLWRRPGGIGSRKPRWGLSDEIAIHAEANPNWLDISAAL
jgi:hypothetical protein